MTLVPRNGRWGVKIWNPGRGGYKWVGTFATEGEALLAEEATRVGGGKEVPTVEVWARVWLSDYPRPGEQTRRTYRYAIDQIVRTVGRLRLDQITRPEARRIATHEWPRNTSRVARTMWADAVRDGVCEVNPWTNLKLETPRGRKDIDALTDEEIDLLGEIALRVHGDYGREAKAIIQVLGRAGLRPAEVCALHRANVDGLSEEVTVANSRVGTSGRKRPKNGLGRRIVLPRKALEALRAVPERLDSPYALHSIRGKPLNKGNLHYAWRTVRSAWLAEGRRHITPYALRHACATHLIEQGVAVGDVAFQLGHQDGGRLVMELYGHPEEDAMRDRIKMAQGTQRSQNVRRRVSA